MATVVKNADRLRAKFAKLRSEVKADILKNSVLSASLVIENGAKARVRVKTGTAKRSISTWIKEQSPDRVVAAIGTPKMSSDGKSLSYTWYLEFKYPFLRPAYDQGKNEAKAELHAAIAMQISKCAR